MSSTDATKELMLNAIDANKIRLHSGETTDGTDNLVKLSDTTTNAESAASWAAASGAERDLASAVSIGDLDAGSVVSHFSFWNGTTYRGSAALDNSETYTGAGGTCNLTSAKFTLADLA